MNFDTFLCLNRWLANVDVGLRRYLLAHIILPTYCTAIIYQINEMNMRLKLWQDINKYGRQFTLTRRDRWKKRLEYYKQFL